MNRDLPRLDQPLIAWLIRRLRAAKSALLRYRAARRTACLRCGRPADGACAACRSLVCSACALVSIETGEPMVLCLGCSGGGARRATGARRDPALALRYGASLLAVAVAALALLAWWQAGGRGVARLAAVLLSPAVLLGLVPLAFLLGAVRLWLGRLFARRVLANAESSAVRSVPRGDLRE